MPSSTHVVLLGSQTATDTVNGNLISNVDGARGIHLILDITASGGTSPTLDAKLQGYDPESAKYVDIHGAAFAQKTGTGTDELTLYPGIAETANTSVSDVLPGQFRAVATIAGTDETFTFSLAGWFIP